MRYDTTRDELTLSATDLANSQRCERLVQLDRQQAIAIARGEIERVEDDSLAIRKGREFEEQVVAELMSDADGAGQRVADLRGEDLGWAQVRASLEQAIREGVEVILQAPLRGGRLGGYADVLLRVDDALEPGGSLGTRHRYEPVEIKYARSVRPAFVLQTCVYASVLEQLCGEMPRTLHVWTGDGARHEYDSIDFLAHYRAAAARLESIVSADLEGELAAVPAKIAHCAGCRWESQCGARRLEADHLSQVANIRGTQVERLTEQGVETMAQLASCELERVEGIGTPTFERIRTQARLQVAAREPGAAPGWEFRRADRAGRGFALLPIADDGDMFFDFEGYPYHESGGLEYLWGWTEQAPEQDAGSTHFLHYWCDTVEGQGEAFAKFLTYVTERREQHPDMHVYHYAPYEITQLKRLALLHPEHGETLTQLLRDEVFVDLYAVVAQSMLIGTSSYSIKYLEPLYGFGREGAEVATAGASIEEYERWLDTGDTAIRDAIIAYNRDDCDSTIALRDWLLERREEALGEGVDWLPAVEAPPKAEREADEEKAAEHAENARVNAAMVAFGAGDLPASCDGMDDEMRTDISQTCRFLAAMPGCQSRETRQFFGEMHAAKHQFEPDDYIDLPQAMGGLVLAGVEDLKRGTMLRTFQGPAQDTLIKPGHTAYDPVGVMELGEIIDVDAVAGTISIKTIRSKQGEIDGRGGVVWDELTAIVGRMEVPTWPLESRAREVAWALEEAVASGMNPFEDPAEQNRAARELLAGRSPVVLGLTSGSPLVDPLVSATPELLADVVERLVCSHLVVQGPPGTGKTWITARTISILVSRGLRVGISSNSHSAIRNLIRELDAHLKSNSSPAAARSLRIAYSLGGSGSWEDAPHRVLQFGKGIPAPEPLPDGTVIVTAGTAWSFSGANDEFDVIFVDEAGQLALLHTNSIAAATTRLVLVGDPQQLAQPSPVQHPEGIQQSPLDLLFDGAHTLPPDEGVLLNVTHRMHPAISAWISDAFYDGRVEAHGPTRHHWVECAALPDLSGAGLRIARVEHAGRSVDSQEEADRIRELFDALLDGGATVVDHDADGNATAPRAVTLKDIVVVAPYNRQVQVLQATLPAGARVGTVDKFQGREAPIAIWSVTSSSRDDVPRGLDFLLSPNRMNVAISRARALAIVVASPALLATRCSTLDEMRLVNRLQLFAERAVAV